MASARPTASSPSKVLCEPIKAASDQGEGSVELTRQRQAEDQPHDDGRPPAGFRCRCQKHRQEALVVAATVMSKVGAPWGEARKEQQGEPCEPGGEWPKREYVKPNVTMIASANMAQIPSLDACGDDHQPSRSSRAKRPAPMRYLASGGCSRLWLKWRRSGFGAAPASAASGAFTPAYVGVTCVLVEVVVVGDPDRWSTATAALKLSTPIGAVDGAGSSDGPPETMMALPIRSRPNTHLEEAFDLVGRAPPAVIVAGFQ